MTQSQIISNGQLSPLSLEESLSVLTKDYSPLNARIRSIQHSVTCQSGNVTLHMYHPAVRQGAASIYDLVEALYQYLAPFSLPQKQIELLKSQYGKIPVEEFQRKVVRQIEEARRLFIEANKLANKNGEAGELLLYIFTEWILEAPQLVAKMSLKTNRSMAIHGCDGIHIAYSASTNRLIFYWGESKLYADVTSGIKAALSSIKISLEPDKIQHELDIVKRYIDFSGISDEGKYSILKYLDPFDEASNEKMSIPTCLVGFDFESYIKQPEGFSPLDDCKFAELARSKLLELAFTIADEAKKLSLTTIPIEFFLFPVPSVQDFRNTFQDKIGWRG